MDAARSAIEKITGRGGAHDTSVEEVVNPAVTSETIKPTRHEETTQAIDKEIHQDHYHTTVQPLQHREVLPEAHQHQTMPVQEREFHHGDSSHIQEGVQRELGQFESSTQMAGTSHTSAQAPTALGEHTHHHVHETVQPIIHKETIQPSVVHTTIPIHEKHHAPSEHHGMSTMPVKNLGEFQSAGIPLTGTGHRTEHYEGDPRHYNPDMQLERHEVDIHPEQHDGLHDGNAHGHSSSRSGATAGTGAGIGGTAAAAVSNVGHHHDQSALGTSTSTGTTGYGESGTAGYGETGLTGSHTGSSTTRGLGDTPAHNVTTGDNASSTIGNVASHVGTDHSSHQHGRDSAHTGHQHTEGHGITNQQHHGSTLDNVSRDDLQRDDIQHGTQPRDPAMVDDRSDKKLTGTGADGSHSAVFGLTPDGHKYKDTKHASTPIHPAHGSENSKTGDSTTGETVADQINDPRVAEKGHGGQAVSATGSGKPGAGLPTEAGSQGFGNV